MARIEWVKQRLENWALWKERECSGGLGFSKQSVFLHEVVDRYREVQVPVDELDGALTNDAVESLKVSNAQVYAAVCGIYLLDQGVRGVALRLGRAESTIKGYLEQADRLLAAWFSERAEKKKKKQSSA